MTVNLDLDRHDTLLVACANADNRAHLRYVLEERYNLLEALTPKQMLLLLQQNMDCIAAVIVDASMQLVEDKLLLLEEQSVALLNQVPVIVASEDDDPDKVALFYRYGAADVIPLRYEPYAFLRRIESIAQLHQHKQRLETLVHQQRQMLQKSNETVIDALSTIVEYRSVESGYHILRIRYFTKILMQEVSRQCPEYGLTERTVDIISSASALHDIGKIGIPDAILMKPDRLDAREWEIMKTHSAGGSNILNALSGAVDQEYLRYAYNICRYHHERWDGKGYPEGLKGDEIPICAQVVGLADAYDALTSKRVYKESYSFVQAVNMILKGECGQFSPKLLECFKHVTEQFDALSREYADGRSPGDAPFDVELPALSRERDSALELTQAQYFSLVHYLNAFLVEVELDRGLFHVVYNPYPELANLEGINRLTELINLMLQRIVVEEEQNRMYQLIYDGIPQFVSENLRRATYYFHYRSQAGDPGGLFEMTLLRSGGAGSDRHYISILCRKLPHGKVEEYYENAANTFAESIYVCRNDKDFTLVDAGGRTPDLGGFTMEEFQAHAGGRLIDMVHPEDREYVRAECTRQLETSSQVRMEHRVLWKNGETMWVDNEARLVIGADGQEYLHCLLSDITPSKRAYMEMRKRLNRYQVILSQTENVLFEWDMRTGNIDFSDTWEGIFGYAPMEGNALDQLGFGNHIHPDDLPLLLDRITNLEGGSNYEVAEVRIATARGRYMWCRFRASAIRDDQENLTKVVGIIINIDAEKQAQRALQDRSDRDSLTKLLNKEAGRKRAEQYLARFPNGVKCAMLILDLDNFKHVNDHYGHLFGDAVLTKVAREIEKHFQAQDIVARIGGDEFLILIRGVSDRNLLEGRCQRLLNNFNHNFQDTGMSCSIGIALCPQHGKTYYDLFAHADQALYHAKALGKNTFCFYNPEEARIYTQRAWGTEVSGRIDSDVQPGLAEDSIVRTAFEKLYAASDADAAIQEVMAMLGKITNVSRVYVFENSDDGKLCSNTFEWCNQGIQPEIQVLQNVSYETDIPGYADNFNEEGVFYCPDVSILPRPAYDIVVEQGIHSMLQCAIRKEGRFLGYIGFDECVEQRMWSKEEIQMLIYFAQVLSVFLIKHREQQKASSQAEELRTILDNQANWIYIIDPDTWEMNYVNEMARAMRPGAHVGGKCYQALLGRQTPCPNCPAQDIRQKKTERVIVEDQKHGLDLLAEATLIRWQGREQCLMTCRKLPDSRGGSANLPEPQQNPLILPKTYTIAASGR